MTAEMAASVYSTEEEVAGRAPVLCPLDVSQSLNTISVSRFVRGKRHLQKRSGRRANKHQQSPSAEEKQDI